MDYNTIVVFVVIKASDARCEKQRRRLFIAFLTLIFATRDNSLLSYALTTILLTAISLIILYATIVIVMIMSND